MRAIICAFASLALALPAFAADVQEWTDRTGQFTMKATFIEIKDDKIVILEDEDGEKIEIELDELDLDSRMAAQKAQIASRKNPFKKSGSKPSPFKKSGSSSKTMKDDDDSGDDRSTTRRSPRNTGPAKIFTISKSAARKLDAGAGNMFGGKSWKVEPDGRTYDLDMPDRGLRASLPNIHYRYQGMAMALDGSAAVALWRNPFGGRDDNQPVASVCRFNLVDGEVGRPIGLPQDAFPVAVSEGGDTVLLRMIPERGTAHRLVLASIGSTSVDAIWDCVPFGENEDAGKQSISWAALLPNGNVAVSHHSQAFRVFDPETERALFDAEIARGAVPAISPGGNQIAISNGGTVSIYDTDSFDLVGSVKLPNERLGQRMTFNAEGTELAVAGGGQMAVVDTTTGDIKTKGINVSTGQIESPFNQPGNFTHAGDSLYLVKNQLVDTASRMHVWTYNGLSSAKSAGDKTFLLFDISQGGRTGLGIAGQLPHPPAREIFDQYKDRDDLYAFQPGDSIKIDATGVPAADRQTVINGFSKWASENGVRLDDSAAAVLKLGRKSGKTVEQEYRSFGFRGGGNQKASFTPTLGTGTLTLNGREVWSGETGLSDTHLPFMIHQEVSKVVENARKIHYGRYVGVAPPQYVFDPAVVKIPLGTSTVGTGGFTDTVTP